MFPVLKAEKKAIFTAASKASEAQCFLLHVRRHERLPAFSGPASDPSIRFCC
jgi:hypothetical protein